MFLLTFVNYMLHIHYVNKFHKEFKRVLNDPPFNGTQLALAQHAGVEPAQLNRVLKKTNAATPEFVGRLCGSLPPEQSALLLKAYLDDVLAATAAAKPTTYKAASWRRPLSDIEVSVKCRVKKAG